MAFAWIVFRENVDSRILVGAAAILAGAVILSWGDSAHPIGLGALLIAGACVAWGIDNNLTRKISGADPVQIAAIKGFAAGIVNFSLALMGGATLPPLLSITGAGIVGFLGYGVSLVLFVLALRYLGSARTGAYFSTAPFIGAALAIVWFDEPLTTKLMVAGALMGIGLWLHLAERHEHQHEHEALEHEHRHIHDAHHQHAHATSDPSGEPHTHRHKHAPLIHSHPHYPDLHHRHGHG
jgi:drug/metabolite transporter (DMT)-like permease